MLKSLPQWSNRLLQVWENYKASISPTHFQFLTINYYLDNVGVSELSMGCPWQLIGVIIGFDQIVIWFPSFKGYKCFFLRQLLFVYSFFFLLFCIAIYCCNCFHGKKKQKYSPLNMVLGQWSLDLCYNQKEKKKKKEKKERASIIDHGNSSSGVVVCNMVKIPLVPY